MKWRIWGLLMVGGLLLVGGVGACKGEGEPEEERLERVLFLEMGQRVVVPTSVVRVGLGGTERMEAEEAVVLIEGSIGEREIREEFSLPVERAGDVGDLFLDLVAAKSLWPVMVPGDRATFVGSLEVRLRDVLGVSARGRIESVIWDFVRELRPEIEAERPSTVFANGRVEVKGSGILRPEEGQTWAVIKAGSMQSEGGHEIALAGARLPVEWEGSREVGGLRLDPAVIGVHPGDLSIEFIFENEFRDGIRQPGRGGGELDSKLERTFIASISPEQASRGEVVEFSGRGFVGAKDGESYGMILRFEGVLTPDDPGEAPLVLEGATALERAPFEVKSDELIRQNVWYSVQDRRLLGLGAVPGVFEGRILPIVYDEAGESVGLEWEGRLRILPTKQVVYLKYLPAFSVALDRYGLVNVEREVRDRILEVVRRDYGGLNMEFGERPPANFIDYMTVELGGPDPAKGYSFGYDNSFNDEPKDTGNLYIDEYLGGLNWRAGQEWNNPYGGIFVESFAFFSPTLHPENPYASESFDRVFGPFMPELGGRAVRATEWPDGPRAGEIKGAIRVFGNVVGNTVTHEIGHALGLAHFAEDWERPGHFYHNLEMEGCIMDEGADRSFEQRAELDGEGPVGFSERNRRYLERILRRE